MKLKILQKPNLWITGSAFQCIFTSSDPMAKATATTIQRQRQMRMLVENWKWIVGLGMKTRSRTTEGTPEQKRFLMHDLPDHSALRVRFGGFERI
jgi:hypothetical protein